MRRLYNYLKEDHLLEQIIIEAGGFVILLDDNEIGDYLSKQYKLTPDDASKIQKFFNELIQASTKEGIDIRLLASDTNKYIKVPYGTIDIIEAMLTDNKSDEFYYKASATNDNKVYIYYGKHKLAETGSGNFGSKSLDKEIHENLTSVYFNTDEEYWPALDEQVKTLYGYANLDVWIPSFHAQVIAIKSKYPGKFRAVRIDNEANITKVYNEVLSNIDTTGFGWDCKMSESDKAVNQAYNSMSNNQKLWIVKSSGATRLKREAYDKSDIVIYNESKVKNIQAAAKVKNQEDLVSIKEDMLQLYKDKALIGISLKGLSRKSGKFEMVEFNTEQEADNGVIGDVKEYQVKDILRNRKGKYNIQNGFTILIKTKTNETMEMNLRSFGNSAAFEVKYSSKPPLGKSPVFLWRNFVEANSKKTPIGIANSKTIKNIFVGETYNTLAKKFGWNAVDDSQEFGFESTNISTVIGLQFLYSLCLLKDKDILENLTTWAKAAVAEADYAFPFALTEEK